MSEGGGCCSEDLKHRVQILSLVVIFMSIRMNFLNILSQNIIQFRPTTFRLILNNINKHPIQYSSFQKSPKSLPATIKRSRNLLLRLLRRSRLLLRSSIIDRFILFNCIYRIRGLLIYGLWVLKICFGDFATIEILYDGDFDVFGDWGDGTAEEEGGAVEDVVEADCPVFEDEFAMEVWEEEGDTDD